MTHAFARGFPLLASVFDEWAAHRPVALATVIATHGSSPRGPGAMLAVRSDGTVIGSISGGCVESALYETALDVLGTGGTRVETYGPDGDVFTPGTTCGGSLTVLVERIDNESFPDFDALAAAIDAQQPVSLEFEFGPRPQRHHVHVGDARPGGALGDGRALVRFDPRPRMIVVGSTDFAAEMAATATRIGYHVTVCDARETFTTRERLPDADEIVCRWPSDHLAAERDAGRLDGRTAVVVLTHDPKVDVPVLLECLDRSLWPAPPAYVGAMGSRLADERRRAALRDAGLSDDALASLHSPIGLPIGNRGPAETAIAIAAQIVELTRARQTTAG
ncbi:XdhC/CoxI family protein [Rhodococcus rhodnii]|uniref:Xanthine dehydrogenase n=2 Tax=Rhodococcus rhodnii TaxID=38312 RepID=R7WKF9_9NOCA|nr:XdhC/CoxI family protein [Rhodococcus rhodnii]EOM74499.1 xanthine dehydrogenase [Rhodococcus rhodnii LMG 5362]TXG89187.1 XdhC/CoxI family protein [Rhodococcus rhodnii]